MGLRKLLQVVDAGGERADIALRGADPQHVQDDLRVLGIVLVPPIVQRLPRAGKGHRGDETQLEPRGEQAVSERAVVVAGRLEADDDGSADRGELFGEPVIIRLGREHRHAPATSALGPLDEHLLAVLGHIDRYQHGAGRYRRGLGHDRSASKVLSRQPHLDVWSQELMVRV